MEMYSEKRRLVDNDNTDYGEEPYVRHKTFSVASPRCRRTSLFCLLAGGLLVILVLVIVIGVLVARQNNSAGGADNRQEICSKPPVLLISLDGFWSGYLKRNFTPFINSLATSGVRAEYMRSEFPTETFPNHFSIVTGLHPESHGIVNNKFYDSILKENFTRKAQCDPKWWRAEPIWRTTDKQHGLKSGVYFWPGSEVKGIQPTYFFQYDASVPFDQRVNTVLSWLDYPSATRPQFMAAYFNEPDHSAHMKGPNSSLVNAALSRVDETIKSLFSGLKERGLEDCVNVIIISDHGMTTFNSSELVVLNNLIPPEVVMINGVTADIIVPQADHDRIVNETYDSLVKAGEPIRTYLTKNLPLRLHAGHFNKQRFGDIYLISDEGAYATRNKGGNRTTGMHGYDNILTDMQAIFIGHGPAFKKRYVSEAFANIELYNLMCGLLGITPLTNNGTIGSLYHMLTPSLASTLPPPQTFPGTRGVRESCPYPTDEEVFDMRSLCEDCVCWNETQCADISNTTIRDSNVMLNLNASQISDYGKYHLPWGIPTGGEGSSSCLLTQQDYITLYSNALHIPLWTAFKLTREQASIPQTSDGCLRRDPRVIPPNSSNCSDYATGREGGGGGGEFVPVRLAADLSNASTAQQLTTNLLSNVVPQMTKFNTRVWLPLEKMLRSWAVQFNNIYVIFGSVLDGNRDGERDNDADYTWWLDDKGSVAVPTHFYAVVVKCKVDVAVSDTCKPDDLDAVGLLFQHPTEAGDPSPTSKLLRFSLTPIRDIERVTGVNFFTRLTTQEQNTLELRLTSQLWTVP